MVITLNGQKRDVPDGITILDLLRRFDVQPERVAVELNLDVVKKADYGQRMLKHGDSVEVVSFMGGGQD